MCLLQLCKFRLGGKPLLHTHTHRVRLSELHGKPEIRTTTWQQPDGETKAELFRLKLPISDNTPFGFVFCVDVNVDFNCIKRRKTNSLLQISSHRRSLSSARVKRASCHPTCFIQVEGWFLCVVIPVRLHSCERPDLFHHSTMRIVFVRILST